ncbi:hypothetical protein RRG08_063772 [Elysia crispata]|uniref:Uncharacterized protein n=1 Tax=Elysia crispata TaxID=231223 RepID=A0AAE1AL08_9GAST|nr:hypothetical protein RRG08_063772 [Elysia crispata]
MFIHNLMNVERPQHKDREGIQEGLRFPDWIEQCVKATLEEISLAFHTNKGIILVRDTPILPTLIHDGNGTLKAGRALIGLVEMCSVLAWPAQPGQAMVTATHTTRMVLAWICLQHSKLSGASNRTCTSFLLSLQLKCMSHYVTDSNVCSEGGPVIALVRVVIDLSRRVSRMVGVALYRGQSLLPQKTPGVRLR